MAWEAGYCYAGYHTAMISLEVLIARIISALRKIPHSRYAAQRGYARCCSHQLPQQ